MILSDGAILQARRAGQIVIKPFDMKSLGPNSYDVHLGEWIAQYKRTRIDAAKNNEVEYYKIPKSGYWLEPGRLYLGVTVERTETHNLVPWLDGTSSVGRLGIFIHATAGKGDAGFCGYWTLEISVTIPVKVYAGMVIGQISYFGMEGASINSYDRRKASSYSQQGPRPVPSKMYKKLAELNNHKETTNGSVQTRRRAEGPRRRTDRSAPPAPTTRKDLIPVQE